MILAYFSFPVLLVSLVWLALALMAFWIWSASKAKAALCTLIGALLLGVATMFPILGIYSESSFWLMMFGAALVTLGYYYTVKPIVDKHIQDLKEKAKAKTSSGGSGTPPPTA